MNFVSIRIITADIKKLVGFYEAVTRISASWSTEDFAELKTPTCTLAIGSVRTLQLFGGAIAKPNANQSAIIEFLVTDVDAEFEVLSKLEGFDLVQAPVTMPWGNRSLLFRDTDGNLVNFFTPVSDAAIEKFRVHIG